ncbi:hypothetical protein TWF481_002955 [Arthrobotrys musiformis]|uniref:Zn(2)-C6 fungal-type domain-containing protein n=1 Tax=Arthrobotrys musiformis TaxID=47236 RepID=A0AAV9VXW2_9PEZI
MKPVANSQVHVHMRKSCRFCRQRKIKCSRQNICSACRRRKIDCIYEAEASKGRPRKGVPKGGRIERVEGGTPTTFGYLAHAEDNLLMKLRLIYDNIFSLRLSYEVKSGVGVRYAFTPLSPTIERIGATDEIHGSGNTLPPSFGLSNIDNESILGIINYEIIEIVCSNVSSLRCESSGGDKLRLISKSLLMDGSSRTFEPEARISLEDPLIQLQTEAHTISQMVDIWLSEHPLSCIISKTLLLHSVENSEYDPALLSIILSDAFRFSMISGGDEAKKLYHWAIACLQNIPDSTATMSTAQTLILLGWYELRQNRPKRAICYFIKSSRVVQILWEGITGGEGPCTSQINGMREREVQTELIINMQLITSALRLWMLLQANPSFNLTDLQEAKSFATPLISKETNSKLIELDLASDNVSTLNAQAKSIRSLFFLSVTTFTASRLLVIYHKYARYFPSKILMQSFTEECSAAINNVRESFYGPSQNPMSMESDLMFLIFESAIFFPNFVEQDKQGQPIDERNAEELIRLLELIPQQPSLSSYLMGQEIPRLNNNAELPTELIAIALGVSAHILRHLVGFYGGGHTVVSTNSTRYADLARITATTLDLLESGRLPLFASRIRDTKRLLREIKLILQNLSSVPRVELRSSDPGSSDWSVSSFPMAAYYTEGPLQIVPGVSDQISYETPTATASLTISRPEPAYTTRNEQIVATTFLDGHQC